LLAVQAFVAEATVEAFDEPAFPWARRGDVDRSDVLLGQPLLEILRDKLRAFVGADELRRKASYGQLLPEDLAALVAFLSEQRSDPP